MRNKFGGCFLKNQCVFRQSTLGSCPNDVWCGLKCHLTSTFANHLWLLLVGPLKSGYAIERPVAKRLVFGNFNPNFPLKCFVNRQQQPRLLHKGHTLSSAVSRTMTCTPTRPSMCSSTGTLCSPILVLRLSPLAICLL